MKDNNSKYMSQARRLITVFGLMLIGLAGFLIFNKSAEMQVNEEFDAQSPEASSLLGKLAYQTTTFFTASSRVDVNIVNADGTPAGGIQVEGGIPTFNGEPAWSPDGTKLAYATNGGGGEIFTANSDGSNKINITNTSGSVLERNPSWSATGKIAYERDSQIWTMNADGSNQMRFSGISQPAPIAPAWSPDGAKLAFASSGEIYVINADGTNERRVTNNATVDADPAWSPDGSKIVYGKGTTGIAVINLDGTNETNLTNGAQDGRPSWSSDNTKIAFVRRGAAVNGIYLMNPDGSNQSVLVTDIPNPRGTENDNPTWQPTQRARPSLFDFDGDGKADLSVFRPSNGFWYELRGQNNSFYALQFGQSSDRIAPADYDGDKRADIAVFRDNVPGAGDKAYFYITNSSDNTFRFAQFGTQGDVPMSGDWDGDGIADLAVYRNASTPNGQSFFFYRPSSQLGVDFRSISWGTMNDKPLMGDFDGDGKLDAAVVRPSTATWFILKSSDNQFIQQPFGLSTDIPTPADYDGDGKTNIAVFRPSNGFWYTSTNPQINYGAVQLGAAGDLPVPADYDGDGKADVAVYRPSNGVWYLLRSTAGFTGIQFGTAEDRPVSNIYTR